MFLGSFPHIPTLWYAVHLKGIVRPVTAAPAVTEPALFLFCVRCVVCIFHRRLLREADALNN